MAHRGDSLKKRLDRSQPHENEDVARDFDIDTPVETGFQLATFQGPLCGEPVEGLAYFVESLETNREGLEKEIGGFERFRFLPPC